MAATTRYVMMLKHGVRRSGGAVWLQQRSVMATHVGCVTTTAPATRTRGVCVSSAALPHLTRHRTLQRARPITTSTAPHSGESFHTSQLPTLGGIRQHIKQDCARCVWGCARHCIEMNTQTCCTTTKALTHQLVQGLARAGSKLAEQPRDCVSSHESVESHRCARVDGCHHSGRAAGGGSSCSSSWARRYKGRCCSCCTGGAALEASSDACSTGILHPLYWVWAGGQCGHDCSRRLY